MVAALGIVFAIAAVLAVVVTALFVGVCLLVAWITGSVSGQPRRQVRGRGAPGPAHRAPGRRQAPVPVPPARRVPARSMVTSRDRHVRP